VAPPAHNLLLGDLTKLIKTVKGIRAAWRDTEDGPVPIDVSDATHPQCRWLKARASPPSHDNREPDHARPDQWAPRTLHSPGDYTLPCPVVPRHCAPAGLEPADLPLRRRTSPNAVLQPRKSGLLGSVRAIHPQLVCRRSALDWCTKAVGRWDAPVRHLSLT